MFGRIPFPRLPRLTLAALSGSIALAALLAAGALASSDLSPRQLMRFGVDAARQGLWREAASRWEHAVKDDAKNPRLHNNLAVAYESIGRLEDADREYREARRLAPDSVEIRDNQQSFLQIHTELKKPEDAGPPAPASPPPAQKTPAAGTPPAGAPPAGAPPTATPAPGSQPPNAPPAGSPPAPAAPPEAQPSPPPPDPR